MTDEPVVCAQCNDGSEPLWECGTAEGPVPLHKECLKFWFRRYPQPKERLMATVHITEVTTYRKHQKPALGPLGDSLDDFPDVT